MTFKTLKNHKSYFAEVGIINRPPGSWGCFMTQPPLSFPSTELQFEKWMPASVSVLFLGPCSKQSMLTMHYVWCWSKRMILKQLEMSQIFKDKPEFQVPAWSKEGVNLPSKSVTNGCQFMGLRYSPRGLQTALFSKVYPVTMSPFEF